MLSWSLPQTWAAGTEPTIEEFRAWLLLLPENEQLLILKTLAEEAGVAHRCEQEDHIEQIKALDFDRRRLMKNAGKL